MWNFQSGFSLVYSKIWEEKDKLRKELLSKKRPELDNLGNYHPTPKHYVACSGKNPRVWLDKCFTKRLGK